MSINLLNCEQSDNLRNALACYGDTWRAYRVAYEMAYYNEFKRLPDDAVVIERVEVFGDSLLIIHADPQNVRQ